MIMTLAMLIAGFIVAFLKGWLLTLVNLCAMPTVVFGGYLYASAITNTDKNQYKDYESAGGRAEQAISAIKTVKQMNG